VVEKRAKKSISLARTADSADGLPDEEGRKAKSKEDLGLAVKERDALSRIPFLPLLYFS
jgi:hypothetical protein